MNRRNKQSHAATYMRVGSIQQLFSSNADMARHLFKELLNDGQEHSTKEINNYIFEKPVGWGVDSERLTAGWTFTISTTDRTVLKSPTQIAWHLFRSTLPVKTA